MNERYTAFVTHHGHQPMHRFMAFISDMAQKYAASNGHPTGILDRPAIADHADFTAFIKRNAHTWEG